MKATALLCTGLGIVFLAWSATANSSESLSCSDSVTVLNKNFETGRFSDCQVTSDGKFVLSLEPEDRPINPSPWYAFRIDNKQPRNIEVILQYRFGKHRYRPKISTDRITWQGLNEEQFHVSEDKRRVILRLSLQEGTQWIAAQPILDNQDDLDWLQGLAAQHAGVELKRYGYSVQKRPLYALVSTTNEDYQNTISSDHLQAKQHKLSSPKPMLVIFGRQHPPEVTGAIAMRSFVNTILSSSPLAISFRSKVNVLVLPSLNPDGIAAGNWRHNVAGVDLNRDWGPFSQPETRQAKDFIELYAQRMPILMTIDFHSTWQDIFYKQPDTANLSLATLVTQWLGQLQQHHSPVSFIPKPGLSPDKATTKTYFYENYQVPAITYELGDNTATDDINRSSQLSAQLLMQLLLDKLPNSKQLSKE